MDAMRSTWRQIGALCLGFLVVCASGISVAAAELSLPATIVTCEQQATVALAKEAGGAKRLVLAALGRDWAMSSAIEERTAIFDVPKVRVRTTFQIVDPAEPKSSLGELIAYPSTTSDAWNEKFVLSLGPSVSPLVRQFLTAHQIPFDEWSGKNPDALAEQPGLLVVGKAEAGTSFKEASELRLTSGRNLLVLDADWYTHMEPQFVRIDPWSRIGDNGQPNREPPANEFPPGSTIWNARFDRYWPGVASRKDFLFVHRDDHSKPSITRLLVEQVWVLPTGEGIFLSYLDWESLLGRSDEIDYWFPRLLQGTSEANAADYMLEDILQIVWPPLESVSSRDYPVLAALQDAQGSEQQDTDGKFPSWSVLDLRGPDLSPEDVARIKPPEWPRVANTGPPPMMVLGTDARLHGGIWAKGAPHKLASEKFADQFHVERSLSDQLPVTEGGAFTEPESRMQQVYRLTSICTKYGIFIPPRQLEFFPEPLHANHK